MTSADLPNHASLKSFAWLSIAAAVTTIGLKTLAYVLTGSVGLLSDALESLVNLVGALMALAMLTIAALLVALNQCTIVRGILSAQDLSILLYGYQRRKANRAKRLKRN